MHLYDDKGLPVYKVPYADSSKGLRDATLRDARKLGLYPSVTEIIKILDKPGLNNWKENGVLESALTLPREPDESDESYIKRIKFDSQEISRIARDKGVAIHKAIEHAFQAKPVLAEYKVLAHSVKAQIVKELGHIKFSERSFSHIEYGYGGTIDLGNDHLIADIKTKEILDTTKKLAWIEHLLQLVAYAHGLNQPDATLVNIFVSWDGEVEFVYWDDPKEVAKGWKMFQLIFDLWCLLKNYDPRKDQK